MAISQQQQDAQSIGDSANIAEGPTVTTGGTAHWTSDGNTSYLVDNTSGKVLRTVNRPDFSLSSALTSSFKEMAPIVLAYFVPIMGEAIAAELTAATGITVSNSVGMAIAQVGSSIAQGVPPEQAIQNAASNLVAQGIISQANFGKFVDNLSNDPATQKIINGLASSTLNTIVKGGTGQEVLTNGLSSVVGTVTGQQLNNQAIGNAIATALTTGGDPTKIAASIASSLGNEAAAQASKTTDQKVADLVKQDQASQTQKTDTTTPVQTVTPAAVDDYTAYQQPAKSLGEFAGLEQAIADAAARGTVTIGNTEANSPMEAMALAQARNPNAQQFTYGGQTYTISAMNETLQQIAAQNEQQAKLNDIKNAPTFGSAFKAARELLGDGKTFEWQGQTYTTNLAPVAPPAASSDQSIEDINARNLAAATDASSTVAAQRDQAARDQAARDAAALAASKVSVANDVQYDPQGNVISGSTGGIPQTALGNVVNTLQTGLGNVVQTGLNVGSGLIKGSGNLIGNVGTLYGLATGDMNNLATQTANDIKTSVEALQSSDFKAQQATMNQAIAQAGGEGVLNQIGETLKQAALNPVQTAEFLATNVPSLFVGGGAIAAAKMLGAGMTLAEATGILANATIQGADIAGDTYARAIQKGETPEEALASARTVGLLSGIASAVANKFIPGAMSTESIVAAENAGKVVLSRALLGEVGAELAEEGSGKIMQNIANGDPWNKDLGATLAQAAIASGGVTAAITAANNAFNATGEIPKITTQTGGEFLTSNIKSSLPTSYFQGVNQITNDVADFIAQSAGTPTFLDSLRNQTAALVLVASAALTPGAQADQFINQTAATQQTVSQSLDQSSTQTNINANTAKTLTQQITSNVDPTTAIQNAISGAVKNGSTVNQSILVSVAASINAGVNAQTAVQAAVQAAQTLGVNTDTAQQLAMSAVTDPAKTIQTSTQTQTAVTPATETATQTAVNPTPETKTQIDPVTKTETNVSVNTPVNPVKPDLPTDQTPKPTEVPVPVGTKPDPLKPVDPIKPVPEEKTPIKPVKEEPTKTKEEEISVSVSPVKPPKKTSSPTISAFARSPLEQALSAYRPPGEVEGESGIDRQNVWNEASLRLKDALGI